MGDDGAVGPCEGPCQVAAPQTTNPLLVDVGEPPDGKRLLKGYLNKVISLKTQICVADVRDQSEQNTPLDKHRMQNEDSQK